MRGLGPHKRAHGRPIYRTGWARDVVTARRGRGACRFREPLWYLIKDSGVEYGLQRLPVAERGRTFAAPSEKVGKWEFPRGSREGCGCTGERQPARQHQLDDPPPAAPPPPMP